MNKSGYLPLEKIEYFNLRMKDNWGERRALTTVLLHQHRKAPNTEINSSLRGRKGSQWLLLLFFPENHDSEPKSPCSIKRQSIVTCFTPQF